jgi:DNA polymerase III subunit delta
VLRGDETTWTQIADAARSPSLFSPRLAVVIRDAERVKGDEEALIGVLEDPADGITLVLLAVKPDGRKRVWRQVQAKARIIPAEPLKGRALRARVVQEFKERDLTIDDEGLDSLIERVGGNLRRLLGEVEKLMAFASPRRAITLDDVAAVMGKGLAQPIYKLSDALMARHPAVAVAFLEEILDEGEAAPMVLAALFRTVRQVRGARALGNAPPAEFASRLGVLPFKVEDVRRAARGWSSKDVKEAVSALTEADRRIKTGVDPRTALTAAIVACSRGSGAPTPYGSRR